MADAQGRSPDFKTPECRISFAFNLFKPRKEKFGCTLIFPRAMLKEKVCQIADNGAMKSVSFEEIVGNVIVEKWGEKGLERARQGLIKSPFLMGDGKEARSKKTGEIHPGLGPDVFFIRPSANADRPPQVSNVPHAMMPASEAEVYSGCHGFAVLNAFTWTHAENGDGVSFGINMFFKKRDGERLGGGGSDPDQWTETVEDEGEAPAETTAGAGAGGLFG